MDYKILIIKAVMTLVALLLAYRQDVSATQSWVSSLYQPGITFSSRLILLYDCISHSSTI